MIKQKLHFRRFEFKYLLPKKTADKMMPVFYKHMDWDDNLCKSDFYVVNSLYFDSFGFGSYWEKVSGVGKRKKFRLRYYDEFSPEKKVFLEIKRKDDVVVVKDRVALSLSEIKDLLSLKNKNRHIISAKDKTINEFIFAKYYNAMMPSAAVSYKRRPLVGIKNKKLRVTFDYDIETWKTNCLSKKPSMCKKVTTDELVLEIKFNNSLPLWLYDVIQTYNLQREAFSKYCFSLERLYPQLTS